MVNRTTEDYVKSIYALGKESARVSTSALAAQLGVADASITGMLRRLSRAGLVRYERYRGVSLTPYGRRLALKIVRRHRLWEMFLMKFLEYSWDEIHAEAERLEHVTSDALEERLDRALGFPVADPHGDPIPTADGRLGPQHDSRLSDAAPGSVVTVARISDADPEVLKRASTLGIGLQRKIHVKEQIAVDGSLRVRVGSKERFISAKLAENIYVEEG